MAMKTASIHNRRTANEFTRLWIIGASALALGFAGPAAAGDSINIGGVSFGDDDGDFLEQLIKLDADDIEELRAELADAHDEIMDAIAEVEEAKAELQEIPNFAIKVALSGASVAVSTTTNHAFKEVRSELDRAEQDLEGMKDRLSAEEFAETEAAIAMLREELATLEDALDALSASMRA